MTLLLPTTISSVEYGSVAPNRNNAESWVTIASAGALLQDQAGQPLQVTVQPPADCYFAVELRCLIDGGGVSSGYLETFINASPLDADGRAQQVANLPIGARLTLFSTYISGIFRLRAGTLYTFSVRLSGSFPASTVRYYGGAAYTELSGRVIGY